MKRTVVGVVGILISVQLALSGCSSWSGESTASGELTLQSGESVISFVGIKNNAVAVPGSFASLRGGLSIDGRRAWVEVALDLLSTGNEERDQNISVHYFNAREFPLARFSVDSVSGPESLPPVGGSVELVVNGVLEIHGSRIELAVPVRLTREGERRVRVRNTRALVLTSEQLGLAQQHAILKAVCGHEALSAAVPIDFDLVFAAGS